MRVGLYNRYLATMGGGERLSLSIAEYLSQNHTVTVISHDDIAKDAIADRFRLNLSRVEFHNLPARPPREITAITSRYDLFINVTDMTYFPSLASINVNLVYFPASIYPRGRKSIRSWLKLGARRFFRLPTFIPSPLRVEHRHGSPIWLFDSPVTIRLPAGPSSLAVSFSLRPEKCSSCKANIFINGKELRASELLPEQWSSPYQIAIPGEASNRCHEITIKLTSPAQITSSKNSVKLHLTNLKIHKPLHRAYRLLVERPMRSRAGRLYCDLPKTWILDYLKTYHAIWAISEYTREWINRYWGRESDVLYSPVDVQSFRMGQKREQILSVGRFFAGRHNKKHLEMIRAFREMVDDGLAEWELHLAGGSTPGAAHSEYLAEARRLARDYPIAIHVDLSFNQLVDLYKESAIYWHATGFGESVDLEPEKFEHFGITTIEAMASGCVPVVIATGGQPEIVRSGVNGYLWSTLDELKALSLRLIRDPQLQRELSASALRDSRKFDKIHFQTRLQQLLEQIGFPAADNLNL